MFKTLTLCIGGATLALAGTASHGAAPRTHTIIIDKMKFGPVPKNVRAGDVILWVNRDTVKHTASARDRSFNINLAPSARGKTVVKRSGAFSCKYHPRMKGRLVLAGK